MRGYPRISTGARMTVRSKASAKAPLVHPAAVALHQLYFQTCVVKGRH